MQTATTYTDNRFVKRYHWLGTTYTRKNIPPENHGVPFLKILQAIKNL